MLKFKNVTNGFNYTCEAVIPANSEEILKMPVVSANKRGINDIGYAVEDGIELYATISSTATGEETLWQKINIFDEINKTTSFVKIVNTSDQPKRINIRTILN